MTNKANDFEMLDYLSKQALDLTEKMLEQAKLEDIDAILMSLEQRERVISIISSITKHFDSKEITTFAPDFSRIMNHITHLDQTLMTDLIRLKEFTHLEIAKTFKTKENFKGYNLNKIK